MHVVDGELIRPARESRVPHRQLIKVEVQIVQRGSQSQMFFSNSIKREHSFAVVLRNFVFYFVSHFRTQFN